MNKSNKRLADLRSTLRAMNDAALQLIELTDEATAILAEIDSAASSVVSPPAVRMGAHWNTLKKFDECLRLKDDNLSDEAIARATRSSKKTVQHFLRLRKLAPDILLAWRHGHPAAIKTTLVRLAALGRAAQMAEWRLITAAERNGVD